MGDDNNIVSGPKLQSKVDMPETQMSKKYGIGFKLLQKQGWKGGGLGSKQDGIANPVEVAVRGRNQGLSQDDVTAKLNQNLHGYKNEGGPKSAMDMLLGDAKTRQAEKVKREVKEQEKGWKKNAAPRQKREEYVPARELRKDVPKTYVIRDMTGPQERIVTTLEGGGFQAGELAQSIEFGRLQELKFNMRVIVEQCKIELDTLCHELECEDEAIKSLEDELARQINATDDNEKTKNNNDVLFQDEEPKMDSSHLVSIYTFLEQCSEREFHSIISEVRELRRHYPMSFQNDVVNCACVSTIAPKAKKEIDALPDGILQNQNEALNMIVSVRNAMGIVNDNSWPAFVRQVLLEKLRSELVSWSVREVSAVDFLKR